MDRHRRAEAYERWAMWGRFASWIATLGASLLFGAGLISLAIAVYGGALPGTAVTQRALPVKEVSRVGAQNLGQPAKDRH
jgi:hypothetical protein